MAPFRPLLKLVAVVALMGATAVGAQTTASEPWARGTVAPQTVTGAFMSLKSPDAARLVSASTPVAGRVEIHEMKMVKDVMQMREMPGLDLPAGQTVTLKPGGYHLMLMDLKQPLKDGESVPLTLKVERAGKPAELLQLQVPVKALGGKPADKKGAGKDMGGHHAHH